MGQKLPETTLHRLDVQGWDNISEKTLADVAPWQRLAYGLCAGLAATGTALASPIILWCLVPFAALAALFPVHPFDLIYNHGIRHLTKTGPLPKRGAPARFACGIGAVWVAVTGWAFWAGHTTLGYLLGGSLCCVALLVATTDICIPSMIYRAIFGPPKPRQEAPSEG
ncbi:MAG: DUF4395 domain-containing protein [Thermoanaerobaculia bacterium]